MARELGLSTDADALFAVRFEAVSHLSRKYKMRPVELDYERVIAEVFHRLLNSDFKVGLPFEDFKTIFYKADFVAETAVQFKNETLIADLYELKDHGYRIYLLTDFYLPKKLISQILDFHGMSPLFDDIFVSCTLGKSKESGSIYPEVLNRTSTDPETAIMMGDNKKSDVKNAEKHGIQAIHLKHLSHKIRNRKNLFGDDARAFQQICKKYERQCRKSPHPYSEYVLHFYFFIERLYIKSKKEGLKNLFFLAREGFYLKQLFDAYQEMDRFTEQEKINTHYLRMSRHSALQVALRPLAEEDFGAFKGSLGKTSAFHFVEGLGFSEEIKRRIADELGGISKKLDPQFFRSKAMSDLKNNYTFIAQYEAHRKRQKAAFSAYLDSFAVPFEKEGIHLVDVGWGGTMQENLYHFLEKKIPVTGYYIGLRTVYDIQPDTKRYGLNFSVYPSRGFSDEVLMANGQLYEQLLGAPHGTTLGYTVEDPESFAITYHEENEKQVHENLVRSVQEYMFAEFTNLFESLRAVDYSEDIVQEYLTGMALRTGILGKKKNIEFVDQLSKGFYQNVGENKVGVAYSPQQIKGPKKALLAGFLKSPEKLFRYLVKVKPYMYSKGLYWLSWPLNLSYYYIRFNRWFKKKWLGKGLIR